jgi:NADH:ubiquinone oxidoreductase subunit 5 (subunit L)/multisubunit Na+/H+ antiporter MnhA subunit
MYLLILYFPLVSSICCGLFGHFLGKKGAARMALYCMFISVLISLFIFVEIVLTQQTVIITIIDFIDVYGITIY